MNRVKGHILNNWFQDLRAPKLMYDHVFETIDNSGLVLRFWVVTVNSTSGRPASRAVGRNKFLSYLSGLVTDKILHHQFRRCALRISGAGVLEIDANFCAIREVRAHYI